VRRTYEVRHLPAAEQDLLDILDYIAQDDPVAARAFVDRVEHAIGHLGRFPKSGPQPRDARLRRRGYRLLVVGNYLVFYIVSKRTVQIRRVLHGARRYDFLLRGG
jgi:plasmid stabilization system protein ParE